MTDLPDEIVEAVAKEIHDGDSFAIAKWETMGASRRRYDNMARAALASCRYAEMREACELMVKWFAAENDHNIMPEFWHRVELCKQVEDKARAALMPLPSPPVST